MKHPFTGPAHYGAEVNAPQQDGRPFTLSLSPFSGPSLAPQEGPAGIRGCTVTPRASPGRPGLACPDFTFENVDRSERLERRVMIDAVEAVNFQVERQ